MGWQSVQLHIQYVSFLPNMWIRTRSGAPYSQLFFYSLQSESKQIWIFFASYSNVSVHSQTPFIRIICFIFTLKYSQRFAHKYLIWCKIFTSERIFSYWQIFASNYLFRREDSQNFKRTSLSSEYLLANINKQANKNIRIPANICYTFKLFRKPFSSLRPQSIFGSVAILSILLF